MNKKYSINLSNDGRILSATFSEYAPSDAVFVNELPEGNFSDYLYKDGEYIYSPRPKKEPSIEDQIQSLKQQLSSTDYKIIKCSEAQLLGEELPYDIASLHAERQVLRDKINELEQQLEANEEGGAT